MALNEWWYITEVNAEGQAGNPVMQVKIRAQLVQDGKPQPHQEERTYAIPLVQAEKIGRLLLGELAVAQNTGPGSSGRLN